MRILERNGKWQVKWRGSGRAHARTFTDRSDAEKFEARIARRKEIGATSRLLDLTAEQAGEQVYVLRGGSKVKIGVSADPVVRLLTLQTGSPTALTLAWRIRCSDARSLEAALHQRYAEHRRHGEWFEAGPVLEDLAGLARLGGALSLEAAA